MSRGQMPHVDRLNTIVRLGRVDHVAVAALVADGLRIGNFGEELPDRVAGCGRRMRLLGR